ncbi:hypothetical protein H5410_027066 [Solanum commersonii]|uniref:Uncharacterized protein n=1 Tax=Solanum commersonii TaxID=4109 RepID=A0A9J5Z3C0_SOLCO|nr:hypothetical protein H5410_027066 [Solanum commersonii]
MLEIVTRPQCSLLEVVLSLAEVDMADHHILRTALHFIEVAMSVESWVGVVGLSSTCGELVHQPTTCPQHGTMIRGIHLDQSYRLSSHWVRGGALGVVITTLGVHFEVGHSLFYAFPGRSEAEASGIPSLDAILWFIPLVLILCDLGFSCPFEFISLNIYRWLVVEA